MTVYLLPPTEVKGHLLSVRPGLCGAVWVYKGSEAIARSAMLPGETERELVVYRMDRPSWCTDDMTWADVVCRLFEGVPQDPLWQEVERLLRLVC